ncbi:tRNA lysidine(34) synthetase TilS [uncultured Vibrio sp.]|uniref:tRNA lysidine(34) synthetase TilS n=1 Tax=uncultured Vibrio sp. TaxID=114054 RepID=UPI000910CDCD|nr:tRNA lysidine(34) synthetase TilS [uncultured Vibrio sp.]OIQ25488.1 MAG: tRNA lysidine(34) synthetase TilS [Vibrio sp. MedPE-SWchi]
MNALFPLFSQAIERHSRPQSRLILGFSGGIDSRVLLDLMAQYQKETGRDCMAVHVHHGLSQHADEWAEQCQVWCQSLSIPLFIEHVEIDVHDGQSIEKSARDARYQALAKYVEDGDLLLTGQHSDDQLETFMLALKRGSGPKGLSSMAEAMPFANGVKVRPLLKSTRSTIEQYARSAGLEWLEDESNLDTRFDRNFIRHTVTPPLLKRWPSFHQSVQRSSELCAEQEALLSELLQPIFDDALANDASLNVQRLSGHSHLTQNRLIRMWCEHCGFLMPSRQHIELIHSDVIKAKQDANPEINISGGQVRRFNQHLYLTKSMADVSEWSAALKLDSQLCLPDGLGELYFSVVNSPKSHTVNGADLPTSFTRIRGDYSGELEVIFNPQGLTAHPAERGHSRKLKKLFQEYQVPSWLRRRTPILVNEGRVAAVLGLFVDKSYQGQDCEVMWNK